MRTEVKQLLTDSFPVFRKLFLLETAGSKDFLDHFKMLKMLKI